MSAFVLIIFAVLIVERSDQFLLSRGNGRHRKIDDEKSLKDHISVEFTDEDSMSNYDSAEAPRFKRFDHNAYAAPPDDSSHEHDSYEHEQQNEQMQDESPSPRLTIIVILIIVGVLIIAMIIVAAFICYLLRRDEKETADVLKEGEQGELYNRTSQILKSSSAAAQQEQEQINFVSQQQSEKEKPTPASGPVSSRSESNFLICTEEAVDTGSLAEQLMDTFLSDTSRSKRSRSQSVA